MYISISSYTYTYRYIHTHKYLYTYFQHRHHHHHHHHPHHRGGVYYTDPLPYHYYHNYFHHHHHYHHHHAPITHTTGGGGTMGGGGGEALETKESQQHQKQAEPHHSPTTTGGGGPWPIHGGGVGDAAPYIYIYILCTPLHTPHRPLYTFFYPCFGRIGAWFMFEVSEKLGIGSCFEQNFQCFPSLKECIDPEKAAMTCFNSTVAWWFVGRIQAEKELCLFVVLWHPQIQTWTQENVNS